ncbi:LysR family transcriptional regulator [Pseudomonas rustica]
MSTAFKDFDPARLRCLDLNKLVVFMAVHRSKSASGAAVMLGVTQPAISNTLSDLRTFFGDELFVRRGRRLHATAHANAIAGYLERSLKLLEEAFNRFSAQLS